MQKLFTAYVWVTLRVLFAVDILFVILAPLTLLAMLAGFRVLGWAILSFCSYTLTTVALPLLITMRWKTNYEQLVSPILKDASTLKDPLDIV
jgi:hypothetical protein